MEAGYVMRLEKGCSHGRMWMSWQCQYQDFCAGRLDRGLGNLFSVIIIMDLSMSSCKDTQILRYQASSTTMQDPAAGSIAAELSPHPACARQSKQARQSSHCGKHRIKNRDVLRMPKSLIYTFQVLRLLRPS